MAYCYSYNQLGALLAFFTLQILTVSPFPGTTTKLSLRLIHRRSILSQYHSKEKTNTRSLDDDITAPVMAKEDHIVFMVNISIGEPPVPQLLAMDTGSSFVWVRCTPCDECNDVFDPKKSSTFSRLSSNTPQCSSFVHQQRETSFCTYNIMYMDQSYSAGVLALERFTFMTSTEGTVRVPNAVLGCSIITPPGLQGVLGLRAPTKYHLVARTGNKFSYCIGNITDDQYMYNRLILGDGAIIQGDSTPMMMNKYGHYTISLEGISVGETQLAINRQYDVDIDSGATRTYLIKNVYEPLVAEIKLIDGVLPRAKVEHAETELCYAGNLERDLKGFPIVTLHLAEGADIDLDIEAMFQRSSDGSAFCVAIAESNENAIGVMAQQYYNVGFDLDAKRISFQRIDCELLQD